MTVRKKGLAVVAVFASMAGGAAGSTLLGAAPSSAASSTTTTTGAAGMPQGARFTPNENATHEAGESAQRESQETAGQFPTVK